MKWNKHIIQERMSDIDFLFEIISALSAVEKVNSVLPIRGFNHADSKFMAAYAKAIEQLKQQPDSEVLAFIETNLGVAQKRIIKYADQIAYILNEEQHDTQNISRQDA